ncbi:MAG TPA: cell division protein FtsZ [bacterium (Candidatus Stahlbacteria)]|nr:cell division protein FtsZ [Candidatus Stahlbacteria bacterium]
MIELITEPTYVARIKVVGVGGAGCNAIQFLVDAGVRGVEYIAANTDIQVLERIKVANRIQLGPECTRGLGAGGDPEIGRKAAEESRGEIRDKLSDTDMVFITAGMGGGTGTGGTPIIAEEAKDLGALVVAVVTKPFDFEEKRKNKIAELGIEELKSKVDTLITIPNQRLLAIAARQTVDEAFRAGTQVLFNATSSIAELITRPGLINLDFADIRTVMSERGSALMGMGYGEGENRAQMAAASAISSPLLDDLSIKGAKGLIINISGGNDLTLAEVDEANSIVVEAAGGDPIVFSGVVTGEENLEGKVKVSVIATGIEEPVPIRKETELAILEKRKPDFEPPTFIRQRRREVKVPLVDEDNLDIPTFLRRQSD